jgi:hypothetical protein
MRAWLFVAGGGTMVFAACTVDVNVGTLTRATLVDAAIEDASTENDPPSEDASSSEAGATSGGSSSGMPGGMCGAAPTLGNWVDIEVLQAVAPGPAAGNIIAGTYELVRCQSYYFPEGSGRLRETLVIRGSPSVGAWTLSSELIEGTGQFSNYGLRVSSGTFSADPNVGYVFEKKTCPSVNNATLVSRPSADTLVLEASDSHMFRTFKRVN